MRRLARPVFFFFFPKVGTTFTKRLLYWMRRLARPVFFFFFSCLSTLGVRPLTFPARAREPWTLPPSSLPATSKVQCSETPQDAREASFSSGHPASNST